jgi:hypothetical protein
VKAKPKSEWSDQDLVEHIKRWSIKQSTLGFNYARRDWITENELIPCHKILAMRGKGSLLRLLPLTEHEDRNVCLVAAAYAYDAAPGLCRRVLRKLMEKKDATALFAWSVLAEKDPEAAPRC